MSLEVCSIRWFKLVGVLEAVSVSQGLCEPVKKKRKKNIDGYCALVFIAVLCCPRLAHGKFPAINSDQLAHHHSIFFFTKHVFARCAQFV